MDGLFFGDRVSLTFDDIPRAQILATIARTFSDNEEGLGPEVEDYVACWLEIGGEGDIHRTISNVVLLTNGRYSLDGRSVTIRKIHLLCERF